MAVLLRGHQSSMQSIETLKGCRGVYGRAIKHKAIKAPKNPFS
jgi:hypothetical protein